MKIKYFLLFILTITQLGCNTDDSIIFSESNFVGEWLLISAVTNRAVDYDFDGDSAFDILEDDNCFNIELLLNEDRTFKEVKIDRDFDNDITLCLSSVIEGNWTLGEKKEKILFEFTDSNGDVINTEYPFSILGENSFIIKKEFIDNSGSFEAALRFSRIFTN